MGKYLELLNSKLDRQMTFIELQDANSTKPLPSAAEQASVDKAPFEFHSRLINTTHDLRVFVEEAMTTIGPIYVDIETSGLCFGRDHICGIAILADETPVYVSIGHETGENIAPELAAKLLKPLFESDRRKIGHNFTFDVLHLHLTGFLLLAPLSDTRLIARELHNRELHDYSLKSLACEYIHPNCDYWEKQLESKLKSQFRSTSKENLWRLSAKDVYRYACADVVLTKKLYEIFTQLISSKKSVEYLKNESRLIPIVAKIAATGFAIDQASLLEYLTTFRGKIEAIDKTLNRLLEAKDINYNSTKQVLPLLQRLNIIPINPKTNKPSICVDALELVNPKSEVIELLLERKRLENQQKMLSSVPSSISDGRIRTQLTISAQQGERFSSTGPSLYTGKKCSDPGEVTLRNFIVPDSDHFFGFFDFSSSHFRILAHLCADENMANLFHRGLDFHKNTAAQLFNKPYDSITPNERDRAKPLGFSVIYGMGDVGLAQKLNVKVSEAKEMKQNFLHKIYPKLGPYLREVYRQVDRNGYVLSGIYGVRVAVKREFAYNGLNYQIQATEAEMMKNTLVRLDAFLGDKRSKIALPFHDEVILHLHNEEEHLIPQIKSIVEDHKLRVPMLSEVKIARTSWAEKMSYVFPVSNERNGETECRAGAMPTQTDEKGGAK